MIDIMYCVRVVVFYEVLINDDYKNGVVLFGCY